MSLAYLILFDFSDQKQNWLVTDLLDDNDKQRVILSASGAKLKVGTFDQMHS